MFLVAQDEKKNAALLMWQQRTHMEYLRHTHIHLHEHACDLTAVTVNATT